MLVAIANDRLEQESGFFFNMKHFEDQVLAGEWDEVERYLRGFTKDEDNRYSMKIFFEIRKQKYLEALDRLAVGISFASFFEIRAFIISCFDHLLLYLYLNCLLSGMTERKL